MSRKIILVAAAASAHGGIKVSGVPGLDGHFVTVESLEKSDSLRKHDIPALYNLADSLAHHGTLEVQTVGGNDHALSTLVAANDNAHRLRSRYAPFRAAINSQGYNAVCNSASHFSEERRSRDHLAQIASDARDCLETYGESRFEHFAPDRSEASEPIRATVYSRVRLFADSVRHGLRLGWSTQPSSPYYYEPREDGHTLESLAQVVTKEFERSIKARIHLIDDKAHADSRISASQAGMVHADLLSAGVEGVDGMGSLTVGSQLALLMAPAVHEGPTVTVASKNATFLSAESMATLHSLDDDVAVYLRAAATEGVSMMTDSFARSLFDTLKYHKASWADERKLLQMADFEMQAASGGMACCCTGAGQFSATHELSGISCARKTRCESTEEPVTSLNIDYKFIAEATMGQGAHGEHIRRREMAIFVRNELAKCAFDANKLEDTTNLQIAAPDLAVFTRPLGSETTDGGEPHPKSMSGQLRALEGVLADVVSMGEFPAPWAAETGRTHAKTMSPTLEEEAPAAALEQAERLITMHNEDADKEQVMRVATDHWHIDHFAPDTWPWYFRLQSLTCAELWDRAAEIGASMPATMVRRKEDKWPTVFLPGPAMQTHEIKHRREIDMQKLLTQARQARGRGYTPPTRAVRERVHRRTRAVMNHACHVAMHTQTYHTPYYSGHTLEAMRNNFAMARAQEDQAVEDVGYVREGGEDPQALVLRNLVYGKVSRGEAAWSPLPAPEPIAWARDSSKLMLDAMQVGDFVFPVVHTMVDHRAFAYASEESLAGLTADSTAERDFAVLTATPDEWTVLAADMQGYFDKLHQANSIQNLFEIQARQATDFVQQVRQADADMYRSLANRIVKLYPKGHRLLMSEAMLAEQFVGPFASNSLLRLEIAVGMRLTTGVWRMPQAADKLKRYLASEVLVCIERKTKWCSDAFRGPSGIEMDEKTYTPESEDLKTRHQIGLYMQQLVYTTAEQKNRARATPDNTYLADLQIHKTTIKTDVMLPSDFAGFLATETAMATKLADRKAEAQRLLATDQSRRLDAFRSGTE